MDAVGAVRACARDEGLIATPEDENNYKRVWSRDGIMASLGAWLAGVPEAPEWLERTLRSLAAFQGPVGQIPSNVEYDGEEIVSYGSTIVRIDQTLWFMVGAGFLGRSTDRGADEDLWPVVREARRFIRCWEGNEDLLLYVPRAGSWADEYPVLGYTLYANALRVWAEAEADAMAERVGGEVWRRPIAGAIDDALWMEDRWYAYVGPGTRSHRFDGFGNSLAAFIDLGGHAGVTLKRIEEHERWNLVPAFWPPIQPEDPRYEQLEALEGYGMRNTPGCYHNGGLWPMITGFAAMAARLHGRTSLADRLAAGIARANRLGNYPEYVDAQEGQPQGIRQMAWSAAAELMATADVDRAAELLGALRSNRRSC